MVTLISVDEMIFILRQGIWVSILVWPDSLRLQRRWHLSRVGVVWNQDRGVISDKYMGLGSGSPGELANRSQHIHITTFPKILASLLFSFMKYA